MKRKEQDKGATFDGSVIIVRVFIVVLAASAYKLYSMVQSNIQSSNEQTTSHSDCQTWNHWNSGRYTDSNYIKTLYAQGLLPSDMIADTTGAARKPVGGSVTKSPPLRIKYSFNVVEINVPQKTTLHGNGKRPCVLPAQSQN